MDVTLHLAQDPAADELLGRSPLAALTGMLLDQQIPMEWAFKGPRTIADRLGAEDLDAHDIAAMDPEAFAALLSEKPAVHRYPGSMAKRIQQLCQYLVEHYEGDAEAVWRGVGSGGRAAAAAGGPAGVRQAEGTDLPGPARQAARGRPHGLAGRPPGPTARPGPSGRSPTSPAPTPWPRYARTSRS